MNRLFILLFLLPFKLFAQSEHLIAIPISKEILEKNKVSTVYVYENIDSSMVQTNTYFIDNQGRAFEHIYYEPAYEGGGPFDIERLRWSEDTLGLVQYIHGLYGETGELNSLISDYRYWYSPSGKLLKALYKDLLSYQTVRMIIYDTLNPKYEDKTEWRLLNGDTIHILKSFVGENLYEHTLRHKIHGKWVEYEYSIHQYKNGELEKYQLFRNGKLVNDFDSSRDTLMLQQREEQRKEEKEEEESENNNALPAPEPFTKIVYSDKMDLIFESNAKEKSAKFRLELHYENGAGNEMDNYEVYDNANGLLLIKSNPSGEHKTEFHYLFGK